MLMSLQNLQDYLLLHDGAKEAKIHYSQVRSLRKITERSGTLKIALSTLFSQ